MQYLSAHPEGLTEALITGGLPPGIHQPCSADEAYVRLYRWGALQMQEPGSCAKSIWEVWRLCMGQKQAND